MSPALGVRIITESPVLLAAGPPAHNLIETLDFIPGNTLRGLLAQRFLDQGGDPESGTFRDLFLTPFPRFGFALLDDAQFLPRSAWTCKYHPGFSQGNTENHGVRDRIIAIGEEGHCRFQLEDRQECEKSLESFEGYYDPFEAKECRVQTRLITRTAVDARWGTAAPGQLYSQRVIAEGQTFKAVIEVPETKAPLAVELRNILARPFTAGIGTGRSRGQGWVRVEESLPSEPPWGLAQERFKAFPRSPGKSLLVVTLLSDAIFVDDYLRDLTAPSLTHLAPLKINENDWKELPNREKTFVDTRLVFGFDGEPLWLPRSPRLAVRAGSVFCFESQEGSSPVAPPGNGVGWIGENQGEGYGRAILWHPFHLKPEGRVGS